MKSRDSSTKPSVPFWIKKWMVIYLIWAVIYLLFAG